MKKIAVLTSGGDAPGMNNAVRGVVLSAINAGLDVYGVYEGYKGLVNDEIVRLTKDDVNGVVNKGGTFLYSARLPEFKEEKVRKKAIANLEKHGIEALVVIGGDGSYMGAQKLSEMGIKCIGLPGTIDNDIVSTDYTIGFDTAINTAMDAIEKCRDTSISHNRCEIIELMGRHCGDITLFSGIAAGADVIITADTGLDEEKLVSEVKSKFEAGQRAVIVAIAEKMTDVEELAKRVEEKSGMETRAIVLAHTQRGGVPTAMDRVLATSMGSYAVELLKEGNTGRCVGIINNKLENFDITEALNLERKPNSLYNRIDSLK